MVTGGADRQVRVWDLRMYQELHAYTTNNTIPTSMDISQRGILGIGRGSHATFWSAEALRQKIRDPYMHHLVSSTSAGKTAGPVQTLRFCPFQDVCGIGAMRRE
jgi:U3 small nucleolar RNA-associated protein 7